MTAAQQTMPVPTPSARQLLDVDLPRAAQLRGVTAFVVACVAIAGVTVLAPPDLQQVVPFVLALGPAVIAFGLAAVEGHGSVGRLRAMLTRRPSDHRWWLTLLIPIGWALAVVIAAIVAGRTAGTIFGTLGPTALIIPLVVALPAFAEEIAWRGYAVPRLLRFTSPLGASLILAVPWTAMHLVLQLPGGVNAGTEVWPGVLSLFAYSVILTWAFVGTGGSVLVAALIHAGLNGVVPLMWDVDPAFSWAARAVIAAVIAAIVIAWSGMRRRAAS